MFSRVFSRALVLVSATALLACGGGAAEPCGGKSESFAVRFAQSSYSLRVGVAAEVLTVVTPESCRGDMTFSLFSGSLPAGMSLVNGHITGTPSRVGTSPLQIQIDKVEGYGVFIGSSPRTAVVTISVGS